MLQFERSDVSDSLPRDVFRGQCDARHRVPASFSLTSSLERRRSGGLVGRALVRAQRQGFASRRRRGLNSAVMHARFGCQKVRPRSIDVLPLKRRCQQLTVVRGRDTWRRLVMPLRRDMRAFVRGAPEKQQERRGKQAHQDTRRCHRHVSGYALTNCWNVRGELQRSREIEPIGGATERSRRDRALANPLSR